MPDREGVNGTWGRMVLSGSVAGVGCALLVAFYFSQVFQLQGDQWRGFLGALAFWAGLLFAVGQTVMYRSARPIRRWLASSGERTREETREAFRAALDYPWHSAVLSFCMWAFAGVAIALNMRWFYDDFSGFNFVVLVSSATSGGVLSTLFTAMLMKRALRPLRETLTGLLPGTDERERLIHRLPLAWKLRIGMAAIALVPVVFTGLLAFERASRPDGLEGLGTAIVVLALIWGALGLALAALLGQEIADAAEALGLQAERVAQGDLSWKPSFESEDELGDLARAFERMTGALRNTVGQVAQTADRVDAAAREMESLGDALAAVTTDQVRGIEQATVATDGISEQVRGIADSSHGLSNAVEQSSSSILEMGAAGEQLSFTASALTERVEEVSTSIVETSRAVGQVAENAGELAHIASETSSSMDQMASSLRTVDSAAEETARLSAAVVASADTGRAHVQQTIEGMEAIRASNQIAHELIRKLSERTQEIGAIIDVIDNVADETNLLALNAAIIAAQAGSSGRAFSVVADEIKELADRVMASTKEIGSLIRTVQRESDRAVETFEEGSSNVLAGVELSARAGQSLEEITRAARESGERIEGILEAVREQAGAASHVVELMERVRSGVSQILQAGQEQERGTDVVMRNTEDMRDVALQVHRTTEEQAHGSIQIKNGIESVRATVESIHQALVEQSSACERAARFMEQVYDRTQTNEETAQRMGEATRALRAQAEALRGNVARFQL